MADPAEPLYLPFDADAADDQPAVLGAAPPDSIAYLGLALTRDAFTVYVAALDFGPLPPLWLVLHHTAIPSTTWAPYPTGMVWDLGEAGLSPDRIKAKRLAQLKGIFEHYRTRYGWRAGPHVWCDDRWIYVGTPLTQEGIHAGGGNYAEVDGRRRYSLGLEVIGYYERVGWPEAVMANVAHAVAVLQRKLGTFQLVSGRGPGFVSEHRHYHKPECPGGAVRASTYLPRFARAAAELFLAATRRYRVLRPAPVREAPSLDAPIAWGGGAILPEGQELDLAPAADGWLHWAPAGFVHAGDVQLVAPTSYTGESPIIGRPLGTREQAIAYLSQRSRLYTAEDLATIVGAYERVGAEAGVDWFLALAQAAHETGDLSSWWSDRPRRNPAGLGVTGQARYAPYEHPPGPAWAWDGMRWLEGLSFARWDPDAVRAHLGRLLAYALPAGQGTPAQRALIDEALRLRSLPPAYRGVAETIAGLDGRWNERPTGYHLKVAAKANAMRGQP